MIESLVGLILGLLLGAGALHLVAKSRQQRDEALLRERETALTQANARITALEDESRRQTQRLEELGEQLRVAGEARARLEGVAESYEKLREDLETEVDQSRSLTQKITALTSDLTQARAEAQAAVQQRDTAIASKQAEFERLIQEKELALAAQRRTLEAAVQAQLDEKDRAMSTLREDTKRQIEEQRQLLTDTEKILREQFSAVSMESLEKASKQFLELADLTMKKSGAEAKADLEKRQQAIDAMLKPLGETLEKMEKQTHEFEERRVSHFDQLERGIKQLSSEAGELKNALRKPQTRGAWGEMQLKQILDSAGLQEGVNYDVQHTTSGEEGMLRADFILRLPHNRVVVIDSKAPLDAYWDAMNAAEEPIKLGRMRDHARAVRDHVKKLSGKEYWRRYQGTPDCVVMFLPHEGAYQAAFELDPSLLTDAHQFRVYIANPMSVVNMVHLAAYVLNEERLRQSAHEVREVGVELYKRLGVALGHMDKLGRSLEQTVDNYNKTMGSVDGRILPQADRMRQLGASTGDELPSPRKIESTVRKTTNPELIALEETPTLALVDDVEHA